MSLRPPVGSLRPAVEVAGGQPAVGVDAPVAKERPALPAALDLSEVAVGKHDLLAILRALGDDPAERPRDEGRAPEVELALAADPVRHGDENAVRDRVRAL